MLRVRSSSIRIERRARAQSPESQVPSACAQRSLPATSCPSRDGGCERDRYLQEPECGYKVQVASPKPAWAFEREGGGSSNPDECHPEERMAAARTASTPEAFAD